MVERARQLNPGIEFRQGDMMALDVADGTWAGIAAFYSIIHIPRAEVTGVLRDMRRVLRPGGLLLLAFHVGDEVIHLEEWWGHRVSIDAFFFRAAEIEGCLSSAGFLIVETNERAPYPEVEYQSRRAYVLARKPIVEG
jgi:SAM-dependent methyltransferase